MLSIQISVIKVGTKFLGVTKLGGFTIRGKAAATEVLAVRNLFYALSDSSGDNEDATLGVELAMSGQTIETALLDAGQTS
jgi:hypothetical protein